MVRREVITSPGAIQQAVLLDSARRFGPMRHVMAIGYARRAMIATEATDLVGEGVEPAALDTKQAEASYPASVLIAGE